jgi:hypothetical protein
VVAKGEAERRIELVFVTVPQGNDIAQAIPAARRDAATSTENGEPA